MKTDKGFRYELLLDNELVNEIERVAVAVYGAKINGKSKRPTLKHTFISLLRLGLEKVKEEGFCPKKYNTGNNTGNDTDSLMIIIDELSCRVAVLEDRVNEMTALPVATAVDVVAKFPFSPLDSDGEEDEVLAQNDPAIHPDHSQDQDDNTEVVNHPFRLANGNADYEKIEHYLRQLDHKPTNKKRFAKEQMQLGENFFVGKKGSEIWSKVFGD